ncbi:hypothetical protein OIU76_030637 [Salix suchowensis]|nr:hypothetical protein OIU76_030637 [Salix suchowensis]
MPSVNESDEKKEKGTVRVETTLPVHDHVAPLEIQVLHVDVESSKQGEAQGVHEVTAMTATTVGTLTKNLKEQEQELGKKTGHKLDKSKLPQGDESRMDTISSSADENEAVGSSMNDNTVRSNNGSNTPSPNVKKRKGKKRREASSLH